MPLPGGSDAARGMIAQHGRPKQPESIPVISEPLARFSCMHRRKRTKLFLRICCHSPATPALFHKFCACPPGAAPGSPPLSASRSNAQPGQMGMWMAGGADHTSHLYDGRAIGRQRRLVAAAVRYAKLSTAANVCGDLVRTVSTGVEQPWRTGRALLRESVAVHPYVCQPEPRPPQPVRGEHRKCGGGRRCAGECRGRCAG